jgi:hypothetical protein
VVADTTREQDVVAARRSVVDALLYATPWAVGTWLLCWPLVILVELMMFAGAYEEGAGTAGNLSVLPPPSSPWVWGTVLLLAVLVGAIAYRRYTRALCSDLVVVGSPRRTLVIVNLVVLGVVAGCLGLRYGHGQYREHEYLAAVDAGSEQLERYAGGRFDRAGLLEAGHEACDWLAAKRWGEPPEGGPYGGAPLFTNGTRLPAVRGRDAASPWSSWYVAYVDAQHPGEATAEESMRAWAYQAAWTELCPFQNAVHSDRNGGGD